MRALSVLITVHPFEKSLTQIKRIFPLRNVYSRHLFQSVGCSMGSFPWGPHGPEVSPNSVMPNPTAAGPAPAFEQPNYSSGTPTYSGGGGGDPISYAVRNFVFSWFFMACVWQFFVCLYPVSSAVAVATGFLTVPIFARMLPPDGKQVAQLLGVISGAVVLGVLIRIEYRLAQNTGFRLGRHVLRLALLSLFLIPAILLGSGAVPIGQTTGFFYAIFTHPSLMFRFFTQPVNLGIWASLMVGVHFLLWNWTWARNFWHRRLVWLGLK